MKVSERQLATARLDLQSAESAAEQEGEGENEGKVEKAREAVESAEKLLSSALEDCQVGVLSSMGLGVRGSGCTFLENLGFGN